MLPCWRAHVWKLTPQPRTALSQSLTSSTCLSPTIPHRQRIVPYSPRPLKTRHRTVPDTNLVAFSLLPFLFSKIFHYPFAFPHHGTNYLHFRTVLAHHKNRKIPCYYIREFLTHTTHFLFSFHFFFLLLSSLRYCCTLSLSLCALHSL